MPKLIQGTDAHVVILWFHCMPHKHQETDPKLACSLKDIV